MELLSENSKNIGSEELINPDQIKCPKCGAINKRINSKKPPEKRVYQCCKCKKYVKEKYQNKPQGLPISEEVSCANPDCLSKSFIRAGTNYEGKNRYKCKICKRKFVYQGTQVSAANYLSKDITPEEMYKMDCWDIRVLGLERSSNDLTYTVNFRAIKQDWLKEATKKWMKFCAGINSPSTLDSKMCAIRFFSNFLDIKYSTIQPQAINRDLVVEYLNYLLEKGLTVESRQPKISYLKEFLEYSARFDWIETTKETLVYDGDLPKRTKRLPRFIPQQILEKLDENLNLLPDCIARMIIVVRESGMRISELCHLNFDCIHQDVQGAWWLVYKRFKSKDEHTIPIRPQVAKVIQEQQQYIRENLGLKYPYLFCASENSRWIRDTTRNYTNKEVSKDMNLKDFQPISKLIHPTVVRGYLHQLAKIANITDANGNIFALGRIHQFRHTKATELINNGVPIEQVKRYLGHESYSMTAVYAHIHDKTLKQQMEKLWDGGRVVNIAGEAIKPKNTELETIDLQWLKKNVLAQALPNGYCGRPLLKGPCPHANACLTCGDFRTTKEFLDIHKEQLEQTKGIIDKAEFNGWQRQIEMNEQIQKNLETIIQSLEDTSND